MAFEFIMGVINRRSWLLMYCSMQTFIPEFAPRRCYRCDFTSLRNSNR